MDLNDIKFNSYTSFYVLEYKIDNDIFSKNFAYFNDAVDFVFSLFKIEATILQFYQQVINDFEINEFREFYKYEK